MLGARGQRQRGGRGAASHAPIPAPHARGSRPARGDFTSRCHGSGVRSPVRGAAWVYPAGDTPVPQNPPGVNPFPARQTNTSLRSCLGAHVSFPKIGCHPFGVPHPHPTVVASAARGLQGLEDGVRPARCSWGPTSEHPLSLLSRGAAPRQHRIMSLM